MLHNQAVAMHRMEAFYYNTTLFTRSSVSICPILAESWRNDGGMTHYQPIIVIQQCLFLIKSKVCLLKCTYLSDLKAIVR